MNNWTNEMLDLMIEKLADRKQREIRKKPDEREVSDTELFNMLGDKIKVIKNGN